MEHVELVAQAEGVGHIGLEVALDAPDKAPDMAAGPEMGGCQHDLVVDLGMDGCQCEIVVVVGHMEALDIDSEAALDALHMAGCLERHVELVFRVRKA